MRGSLMKALLIASTVPTKGYCDKDKTCHAHTKDHFMYEGHGRVQLDRVLRFDDSDFELFLYYGQINKKKKEFSIRVPLKISLLVKKATFTADVHGAEGGDGVHGLPRRLDEPRRAGERRGPDRDGRGRQEGGVPQRVWYGRKGES